MKNPLLALLLLIAAYRPANAQTITIVNQTQDCSLRGLSVVNNKVAWVSGSKGHVGITKNGGKTWAWQQVKGFEQSDFRDVEAFSASEAIIMSSGTPALILKTTNGGESWNVAYRNDDKAYFLDAMAFADVQHGYTLGDPIQGSFVLLETKDGGSTWNPFRSLPPAQPAEAAFAASGTCIITDNNTIRIVTGGSVAHVLSFSVKSKKWIVAQLPVAHGKDSQGVFSMAMGAGYQVFVGGDYQNNRRTDSVACYANAKKQYSLAQSSAGYQSCVAHIKGSTFISTGTPGTNITINGGKTWKQIDTVSFNVCRQARHGKLVLLAGDKGKIGAMKIY